MKAILNFLFLAQSSHTLPLRPLATVFLCLLLPSPTCSSSSFCSSIMSFLIRRSLLNVKMVWIGLIICLVLQTPSHLAGPLVMPGSMPGMKGMVQWTIRRTFPAADWTRSQKNRLMDNNWEEMKGMTTVSGMDGDGTGCLDRHESRLDTKTINTVTMSCVLGSWEGWRRWHMMRKEWDEIIGERF